MPEVAIRFVVCSSTGLTGASWKCWTPGTRSSEVYLACRALRGELKASLHESGQWHIAFSPQFYADEFGGSSDAPSSRFLLTWPQPAQIVPGVTLAFRVLTPWSSLTFPQGTVEPGVIVIGAPPEGLAVEVAVLITAPSFQTEYWPGYSNMQTTLVGSFPLFSGSKVWLVYRNTPFAFSQPMKAQGTFFRGVDRSSLARDNLRAIIFGDFPDGSRGMVDVPVAQMPSSS